MVCIRSATKREPFCVVFIETGMIDVWQARKRPSREVLTADTGSDYDPVIVGS